MKFAYEDLSAEQLERLVVLLCQQLFGPAIAQAKHTNGYNRSFSDSDFYNEGSLNTVIGKELARIKRLRQAVRGRRRGPFLTRTKPALLTRTSRVSTKK